MKNPLYGCNVDFVGKRGIAVMLSALLIVASVSIIFWRGGLNYAIDFVGGTRIIFSFAQPVTVTEVETVRATLAEMGLQGQVQQYQERGITIQAKGSEYTDRIHQALVQAKAAAGGKFATEQQVRDALAPFAQLGVADIMLRDFGIVADTAARRLDLNAVADDNLKSMIEKMLGEQIAARVQAAVGEKLGLATDTAAIGAIALNTLHDSIAIRAELERGAVTLLADALQAKQGGYRTWADVDAVLEPLGLKSDLVSSAALLTNPGIDDAIRLNLNTASRDELSRVLTGALAQGAPAAELANGAAAVAAVRAQHDILPSLEPVLAAPGLTPLVRAVVTRFGSAVPFVIDSVEMVGPRVGRDLRDKAMQAVVYCIIAMLVYIGFRFQFKYGVGAVAAVVHDTVITIGILAFFNREFDMTVIAALMTLVGFSLNDTVVIFDRIREKLRLTGSRDWAGTINAAVNETLSRTVITSLTVLIASVALLVFGSSVTFDFALVMTIGVFVGTYSSIFIAAPILIEWHNYFERVR